MTSWDRILDDPAVGAAAALALTLLWVVRRIVTGALVPRATYEDMRDARDAERARSDALHERLTGIEEGLAMVLPLWQEASRRGALLGSTAAVVPRQEGSDDSGT